MQVSLLGYLVTWISFFVWMYLLPCKLWPGLSSPSCDAEYSGVNAEANTMVLVSCCSGHAMGYSQVMHNVSVKWRTVDG